MTVRFRAVCFGLAAVVASAAMFSRGAHCAAQEVEFLGSVSIPGDALDLANSPGHFDGTPHSQLGGFSAIEYDARRDRFILLADRGPGGGANPYQCRIQEIELKRDSTVGENFTMSVTLLETILLTDEAGRSFNGLSSDIDRDEPSRSLRFDPEGIRVGPDGTLYICDEYGPHLFAFGADGKLRIRLPVPDHFAVVHPAPSKREEHAANRVGRQTNRGFEGLAISPDGRRLYSMLQGPLLQDHPVDDDGGYAGLNTRLYELDLETGRSREMVYVLDDASHGISEVLLLGEDRLLVLERDGLPGLEAKSKRIYVADLTSASDVSRIPSLPATTLPEGVEPMRKQLFLDLLDPRFGLANESLPAKIEGLALGPDLPDGRKLLIVCSDNDFQESEPSWFYAFAWGAPLSSGVPPADSTRPGLPLTPKARLASGPIPPAEGLSYRDELTIRGPRSLYDGHPPRNADGTLNVVVEIPAGTNAKWEVTRAGIMDWEVREDGPRVVNYLPYPGNYGMIPGTLLPRELGGDGDALDVLVLGPAVPRGTIARVRLIGVMKFLDKGEQDDKLLAVMQDTPLGQIRSLEELNQKFPGVSEILLLWFSNYKGAGKKMVFQGWGEVDVAGTILQKSIDANK